MSYLFMSSQPSATHQENKQCTKIRTAMDQPATAAAEPPAAPTAGKSLICRARLLWAEKSNSFVRTADGNCDMQLNNDKHVEPGRYTYICASCGRECVINAPVTKDTPCPNCGRAELVKEQS